MHFTLTRRHAVRGNRGALAKNGKRRIEENRQKCTPIVEQLVPTGGAHSFELAYKKRLSSVSNLGAGVLPPENAALSDALRGRSNTFAPTTRSAATRRSAPA